MDLRSAHSLIQALRGDWCIFGYSGHFPDEHSPRLIELGEAVLSGAPGGVTVKGRLGYVMVEAYQNIVRHRARPLVRTPWDKGRSVFLLRCHATGQQVFACNLVTRPQAEKLDNDLADLQGRDNAELKELYLEGIQRTSTPGSRGAGLGLIEMVRRAGSGATWAFTAVDAKHELFAISLELEATGGTDALRLEGPLHRLVLGHRIRFFHVGIWNSAIENMLLDLAHHERNHAGGQLPGRPEVLDRLVQVFRSVCDLSNPLLLVVHGGDQAVFSMGGTIGRSVVDKLRARLPGLTATLRVEDRMEDSQLFATVEVPW